MTFAIEATVADRVCIADDAGVLDAIHQRGVVLALWRRRVSQVLANWLDDLTGATIPSGRVLIAPHEAEAAIAPMLYGNSPRAQLFLRDVADLVRRFAALAKTDLVDLRLDRIDNDACRRFHVDKVEFRLLCTYRGPGTQWVAPIAHDAALARRDDYAGAIRDMPRFAVGLCRGDSTGAGLVHRSPPLGDSGQTRLLLCLNLPSAASPGRWR